MDPRPSLYSTAAGARAGSRAPSSPAFPATTDAARGRGRARAACAALAEGAADRVACGPGNNGGDGYVLARLARAAGLDVPSSALADPAAAGDAPPRMRGLARRAAARRSPSTAPLPRDADLVVDALLGIGLRSASAGPMRSAVIDARSTPAARPVLALDVPSGLDADPAAPARRCRARRRTLTFVGLKSGLYTGAAPRSRRRRSNSPISGFRHRRRAPHSRRALDAHRRSRSCARCRAGGARAQGRARPRARRRRRHAHGRRRAAGARSGAAHRRRHGHGRPTRSAGVAAIVGERPELIVHAVEDPRRPARR